MKIKNRVAVVTGGSKGIGFGIVKEFISKGISVLVIARNEESLANLKSSYSTEQIETLTGDVSDIDLANKALKLAMSKWGRVDILVNNAGGPTADTFLNHDEDAWIMKENNWGRILSITSTIAKEPSPIMVLSATMRAGVAAFNKAISIELAPYNITVNAICPGGVLTDRLVSLVKTKSMADNRPYKDVLKESENSIPIKRFASVEEIAKTANFLCSEDGSYITGVQLSVDGGLSKSY
jgi:3-oxoacyl-[acyl-carrier protein] reductase